MKRILITVAAIHVVALLLFVPALLLGPPMGESELTAWDFVFPISGFVAVVVCPIAYMIIALIVRRYKQREISSNQQMHETAYRRP